MFFFINITWITVINYESFPKSITQACFSNYNLLSGIITLRKTYDYRLNSQQLSIIFVFMN